MGLGVTTQDQVLITFRGESSSIEARFVRARRASEGWEEVVLFACVVEFEEREKCWGSGRYEMGRRKARAGCSIEAAFRVDLSVMAMQS
jgi:hypothetical protein